MNLKDKSSKKIKMNKIALLCDFEIVLYAYDCEFADEKDIEIVFKSKNPESFIDFLKSENVDLLIIDLNDRKDLDIKWAKEFKTIKKDLKIILLSNPFSESHESKKLETDYCKVLDKTILLNHFMIEVKNYLAH